MLDNVITKRCIKNDRYIVVLNEFNLLKDLPHMHLQNVRTYNTLLNSVRLICSR